MYIYNNNNQRKGNYQLDFVRHGKFEWTDRRKGKGESDANLFQLKTLQNRI